MSNLTQFLPGAIKSIQRGTITIANAASSKTATITSVDTTKALIFSLGAESTETSVANTNVRLALTNATTVTAERGGTTGSVEVGYQVVEYV